MRRRTSGLNAALVGSVFALVSVAASANAGSDQKAVAALDTKYQAAVKNNDASTMDRILANDFVVVLGTGKLYSKSDLLWRLAGKSCMSTRRRSSRRSGFGAIPP